MVFDGRQRVFDFAMDCSSPPAMSDRELDMALISEIGAAREKPHSKIQAEVLAFIKRQPDVGFSCGEVAVAIGESNQRVGSALKFMQLRGILQLEQTLEKIDVPGGRRTIRIRRYRSK